MLKVPAVGAVLVGVLAVCAEAAEPLAGGGDVASITVFYDFTGGTATVRIAATDGRVGWGDVLRGIARAKGFDDTALAGLLPDKTFRLDAFSTRGTLLAMDLLLGRAIGLAAATDPKTKARVLEITLDRRAMLAGERKFKRMLRRAVAPRVGRAKGGLVLDAGWRRAEPADRLVVFVHGLHSAPERFAGFLAAVRKAGLPVAAMRYPNDQPLAESAALLSAALKRLARQAPKRRVSLVATSMGGLVCRETIEHPKLAPPNVRQLIMVGTPNHGSRLAEFAFGLEIWEHVKAVKTRRDALRQLYASVEDGLGEAYDDLTPGSAFLKGLNARKRNPKVVYALLLGSGGPLTDAELAALRLALARAGRRNRFVRFLGPRLDAALADMDEVVAGKGDGAVSIARGRLAGVADTIVLPFDHVTMLDRADTAVQKRLRAEVIRRLKGFSIDE